MNIKSAFSGFSVDDLQKAKQFYGETLGCEVKDEMNGNALELSLPGSGRVFIYAKPNHEPATYTTLNFIVEDIDAAVDELSGKGIKFEHYDGFPQDEKGIAREKISPDIAWFKDPAGNIISVVHGGEKQR